MIYFIQQGDTGPIKIGYSKDIDKRLYSLQSASPHPLKVIGTAQGSMKDEYDIQQKFLYCRLSGEWFEPSLDLIKYISTIDGKILTIQDDKNPDSLDTLLAKIETDKIIEALKENEGNKEKAAKYLNISYRSIRHRINKYGIAILRWNCPFLAKYLNNWSFDQ